MNMSDGKRLAIFCLYAPDGIVRFRVTYILKELMTVSDELIVVSNGDISDEGKVILRNYSNMLIIRENIGFDGGAYADVILNHIGKEKLRTYSSLILCNDTFWGPFVPFTEIFRKMDSSDADWWGLNRIEADFLSYIQSYMLVFNEDVIRKGGLYNFFVNNYKLYHTDEVYDIYVHFELALYGYMKDMGYKDETYRFARNACIYESPYQCYAEYGVPILKCKALDREYYRNDQIKATLNEIAVNSSYPVDEIINEIAEIFNLHIDFLKCKEALPGEAILTTIPDYVAKDFIEFSKEFDSTYLYGSGLLGQKINYKIGDKLNNLRGFLVSDGVTISEKSIMGLPVCHYSEREKNSCVIVALDRHNTRQVYDLIGGNEHIMYLKKEYNERN